MPLHDLLPEEVANPTTARRTVGTLALMLLVLLGVNQVVHRARSDRGLQVVQRKWQTLDAMSAPADWLVLGDSSGLCGLRPSALEASLGGTVRNLCTIGYMLVAGDGWMLDEHQGRLGPPRQVVISHAADVWERELNQHAGQTFAGVPRPWGYWQRLRPRLDLPSEASTMLFIHRFVPLLALRKSLGDMLQHPAELVARLRSQPATITGEAPPPVAPDAQLARDEELGFMPDPGANAVNRRQAQNYAAPFKVTEANQVALEALDELSREGGYDIYLVDGPLTTAQVAVPGWRERRRVQVAALRQLTALMPRVHYLGIDFVYPDDWMSSGDHMAVGHAADHSRAVAEAVKQYRARLAANGGRKP